VRLDGPTSFSPLADKLKKSKAPHPWSGPGLKTILGYSVES
jgi:hypothetical protein